MPRIPSRVRAAAACTVTAVVITACASAPPRPTADVNLLEALPAPVTTLSPLPARPPTSPTPMPTAKKTTAKPKPATGRPQRRVPRAPEAGDVPAAIGPEWKPAGGDDFGGGALDAGKWNSYNSVGAFGNGLRRPSAIGQTGGSLVITASGDVSGGLSDSFGQLYGRWEFRARTDLGRGFGSAILLWPDSEKLIDGEIDIVEVPAEQRDKAHFVLHSGEGGDTIVGGNMPGDFSQWHTFAVDWLPDRITWYVDGRARFTVTDKSRIPDTPMHLTIQLDRGPVKDWLPAPDATTPAKVRLQVDWVRVYSWAGAPASTKTPAPPKSATKTSTKPDRD